MVFRFKKKGGNSNKENKKKELWDFFLGGEIRGDLNGRAQRLLCVYALSRPRKEKRNNRTVSRSSSPI
jgi:hypothetical protein